MGIKGQRAWNKGLTKQTSKILFDLFEKRKGKNHPMWKGGRSKVTGGYIKLLMPEHPDSRTDGYVLEHRIVMEKMLDRRLLPIEEVHHKNGIKTDNRPENLELVLKYKHNGTICCPYCEKSFKIK
jgi:hypothetical protein